MLRYDLPRSFVLLSVFEPELYLLQLILVLLDVLVDLIKPFLDDLIEEFLQAELDRFIVIDSEHAVLLLQLLESSQIHVPIFDFLLQKLYLLALALQGLLELIISLPVEGSDLAHRHVLPTVGRKLHGDLVRRQSVELADLELLLRLHRRNGKLRACGVGKLIGRRKRRPEMRIAGLAASNIRLVPFIGAIFGLSVLDALMKRWSSCLLHTRNLLNDGPGLVLAVAVIRTAPVLHDHI